MNYNILKGRFIITKLGCGKNCKVIRIIVSKSDEGTTEYWKWAMLNVLTTILLKSMLRRKVISSQKHLVLPYRAFG
jgi:hypothetical protein